MHGRCEAPGQIHVKPCIQLNWHNHKQVALLIRHRKVKSADPFFPPMACLSLVGPSKHTQRANAFTLWQDNLMLG